MQSDGSLHESIPAYLKPVACPQRSAKRHIAGAGGALQHTRRPAFEAGHASAPHGTTPGEDEPVNAGAAEARTGAERESAGAFLSGPELPQATTGPAARAKKATRAAMRFDMGPGYVEARSLAKFSLGLVAYALRSRSVGLTRLVFGSASGVRVDHAELASRAGL